MIRMRRAAALLLLIPSAGCVFAVGGDDDGNEELRDRVRALEKRIDRLEGGPSGAGFLRFPKKGDPGPGKIYVPPVDPPEKVR